MKIMFINLCEILLRCLILCSMFVWGRTLWKLDNGIIMLCVLLIEWFLFELDFILYEKIKKYHRKRRF